MITEDLDRFITSLIKLSICPLLILVVSSIVVTLLNELPALAQLALLFMLLLLSPIAYMIRQNRHAGSRTPTSRRGAERTPLLPGNEDE